MLSMSLKNIVENIKQPKNPAEVVRNNTDKIISSEQAYQRIECVKRSRSKKFDREKQKLFLKYPSKNKRIRNNCS